MIHFKISGQRMMVDTPIIVAGTYNYLTAEFTFSADWTATKKIAHFELGDELHDIELHDDKIVEADGLNLPAGDWCVSVTGWIIDDGAVTKQITTSSCIVRVVGKNPGFAPMEPSLAERIAAEAMEARTGAEEARHAAEAARDEVQESAAEIVRRAQETVAETIAADLTAAETALERAKDAAVSEITPLVAIAESAASTATTAASQAQSSASSAARDASGANTSARSAAESASTATTAASTATAKATAAAGSASAAQSAKTAAETAKDSAESAKTAAETAQTAAEEARDAAAASATSAAQSAQTATEKAQEIAESADKINAVQRQVNNTDRSLNALWKLNEGQTYDIETVEETGINDAPSGAKYMSPEEIYGKTEQAETKGYQLLEPSGGVISGRSQIEEDGAITVLPVTLGRYMFAYSKGISDYLQGSGSYTLSVSEGVYDGLYAQVLFEHSDGTKQYLSTITKTPSTIDVDTSDLTRATCSIQTGAEGTVVSEETTFHVMFEKGNVAHDYEPYTGVPAPNPDFPEPIRSVEEIRIERNELSRTITPPKPLNGIGEYKDVLDVTNGVWRYVFKEVSGLIWTKASVGESTFQASVADFPKQPGGELPAVLTTDYRRVFTQTSMVNIAASGDMIITCHNNFNGIWINDSRFTDLTAFRQAIADKTFIYASDAEVTIPIAPGDLDFLRSLALTPASDHIIVTDQDDNDVPWLNEYLTGDLLTPLKDDLASLSDRTNDIETALLGVDRAITRLEAAV